MCDCNSRTDQAKLGMEEISPKDIITQMEEEKERALEHVNKSDKIIRLIKLKKLTNDDLKLIQTAIRYY